MDSGGGSKSQELRTQMLKVISSLFELDINASQACSLGFWFELGFWTGIVHVRYSQYFSVKSIELNLQDHPIN